MARMQFMIQRAKLTEEQKGKLRAFVAEQGKDLVPTDDRAIGEFMRKVQEFVMTNVLTDEQKAAMQAPRPEPREGERRPPAPPGERRPEVRPEAH